MLHEQLLSQGFDYEPSVACNPTDASHFTCAVTIDTPEGKTLAETVVVTCGTALTHDRASLLHGHRVRAPVAAKAPQGPLSPFPHRLAVTPVSAPT